ncbi:pleckstrin-like [Rhopilema esculentum]|uniref:pleckstrin-like n=1 Tax=Rhopilema esculentum TaxID=499914 RepID=UPI0031D52472
MDDIPPKSNRIIKEGVLVKKGHKRHNWKSRWFVLSEDGLYYYKSKKDTSLKGDINLRGCCIISPCPEYTKKDCVVRLIEHNGREFLIQCGDKQIQDEWTKAIAEVIRNLEMITESEKGEAECTEKHLLDEEISDAQSIFESKVTYSELLDAMQDSEAGVPLQSFEIDQFMYKLCFTGKDVIDWLLHWDFVKTRSEGAIACGELLEKAHLHPVGPLSRTSVKRKDARRKFCDDVQALYRFSALTKGDDSLDMIFEDDSSDSEEESSTTDSLSESDIGYIVKEGFLLKKGHLRHNWKIRNFILSENPLGMMYFKPSKPKTPQGRISLDGSKLFDNVNEKLEKDAQCIQGGCMKAASLKGYRHQFDIETKKGVLYQLKADSELEKKDWVESIRLSCQRESGRCFSI